MRFKTIIAALAALSIPSVVSATNWRLITVGTNVEAGKSIDSYLLIDTDSMKSDRAWVYSVQPTTAYEMLMQFDCSGERSRGLSVRIENADGTLDESNQGSEWIYDAPGTPPYIVNKFACSGGKVETTFHKDFGPNSPVPSVRSIMSRVEEDK